MIFKSLGHPCKAITCKTAKTMNIRSTCQFQPSEHCSLCNACKAAVNKAPIEHSSVNNKHHFINMSSCDAKNLGSRRHWLLIINDCTDYGWSFILKEKIKLIEKHLSLTNEHQAKHDC